MTTTAWAVTLAVIGLLFAVDLMLGAVRPHTVGFREAVGWPVFYIGIAGAAGVLGCGGGTG